MTFSITTFMALLMVAFAVYSIAGAAGIFSERSGTVNISINGGMILGAFTLALFQQPFMVGLVGATGALYLGMLAAIVIGVLFSVLLAIPTIHFKADHVVTGTALNMLAPALTMFVIAQMMQQSNLGYTFPDVENQLSIHYIIFAMIGVFTLGVTAYIFKRTRLGLRLKTAGENPGALEDMGISVNKMRYTGILISGGLAGLSGAMFLPIIDNLFQGNVEGSGYIALAILLIGNRRATGVGVAALGYAALVAFTKSASITIIPAEFMQMIPFVLPLVVLGVMKFTKRESRDPAALGQPYEKGKR